MIHPAGLGGTPVSGHFCTAVVKAVLDRFLGEVDVAEEATRTETARPYSHGDGLDVGGEAASDLGRVHEGRTSTGRVVAQVARFPHSRPRPGRPP